MPTLSLNDIVNVVINVSPTATVRNAFNLGLIIGKSTIISAVTRVKLYSGLTEMIAGGWAGTEPEYVAAQLYFAQLPAPRGVLIGRWDGTGSETALQAITACRITNNDWYAATFVSPIVKADIITIAAYIEAVTPVSTFFYTTSDSDVPLGTAGNVLLTLQTSGYRRSLGQYSLNALSAVVGSAASFPVVAIMGYAMGAMTGLAKSAYTLMFKPEVGITPDVLTLAKVTAIKGANGNVYISRGSTYNLFETGVMANGTFFDEVINLDVLANDIQTGIMTLFQSVTKIPQTEDGVTSIVSAITTPCEAGVNKGVLSPGIWAAAPILNVNTNDYLSKGYLIVADSIANQSSVDRDARKSPPTYVLVKMAGAVQSVVINVLVNR